MDAKTHLIRNSLLVIMTAFGTAGGARLGVEFLTLNPDLLPARYAGWIISGIAVVFLFNIALSIAVAKRSYVELTQPKYINELEDINFSSQVLILLLFVQAILFQNVLLATQSLLGVVSMLAMLIGVFYARDVGKRIDDLIANSAIVTPQ